MAAAIQLLLFSLSSYPDNEDFALRTWALEQLIEGGAFAGQNLAAQKGVSFLHALDALHMSHAIYFNDDISEEDGERILIEGQILLKRLSNGIPETCTASIPFAAVLALGYMLLGGDQESIGSPTYLQHANKLCIQGPLHTSLALIAVCCLEGAQLERILNRLHDSGCSLGDTAPASSANSLHAEAGQQRIKRTDLHRRWLPSEGRKQRYKLLRGCEGSPLSVLVSKNDVSPMVALLKFGASTYSVCALFLHL